MIARRGRAAAAAAGRARASTGPAGLSDEFGVTREPRAAARPSPTGALSSTSGRAVRRQQCVRVRTVARREIGHGVSVVGKIDGRRGTAVGMRVGSRACAGNGLLAGAGRSWSLRNAALGSNRRRGNAREFRLDRVPRRPVIKAHRDLLVEQVEPVVAPRLQSRKHAHRSPVSHVRGNDLARAGSSGLSGRSARPRRGDDSATARPGPRRAARESPPAGRRVIPPPRAAARRRGSGLHA